MLNSERREKAYLLDLQAFLLALQKLHFANLHTADKQVSKAIKGFLGPLRLSCSTLKYFLLAPHLAFQAPTWHFKPDYENMICKISLPSFGDYNSSRYSNFFGVTFPFPFPSEWGGSPKLYLSIYLSIYLSLYSHHYAAMENHLKGFRYPLHGLIIRHFKGLIISLGNLMGEPSTLYIKTRFPST